MSERARPHTQLTADFRGVPAEQLRDTTLVGGLLIAAASAASFSPIGVPAVRERADGGVSAVLLLDGGHMAVHTAVAEQTLLFDIVSLASHDFRKAVDVFARRLAAREMTSDSRGRG